MSGTTSTSISNIVSSVPISLLKKYCRVNGVRLEKDDDAERAIARLPDKPETRAQLENFLREFSTSGPNAFVLIDAGPGATEAIADHLSDDVGRESLQKTDAQARARENRGRPLLIGATTELETITLSFTTFQGYRAMNETLIDPVFYEHTAVIDRKSGRIRVMGRASRMSSILDVISSLVSPLTITRRKFNDAAFDQIREKIRNWADCKNVLHSQDERRVNVGAIVDSLGLKARGKKDLAQLEKSDDVDRPTAEFIADLRKLLGRHKAALSTRLMKLNFDLDWHFGFAIPIVMTVADTGVISLNTVPKTVYDKIEEVIWAAITSK